MMCMQWIMIMLNDDECTRILNNCHKALPKDGKVIVVDGILPETPDSSLTARDAFTLDIIMFVLFKGAKQRTEKEFAKLAKQSGLHRWHQENLHILELLRSRVHQVASTYQRGPE